MAVINPAGFLQNAGATHTAEQVRNWTGVLLSGKTGSTSLVARGGVNPALGNALTVTQTGSPSMAVIAKSGTAMISGTEGSKQGTYSVLNDADVTLSISAAHATLNRIDLVCFKVEDQAYSGSVNASSLVIVTGTPASSPSAPSAPNNSITLAQVFVGAAVSSIVNANITDTRPFMAALGGIITCTSTTRPAANTVPIGQQIFETNTGFVQETPDGGTTWFIVSYTNQNWTTWTPGLANIGQGNGSIVARYRQIGKTIDFRFKFVLGSTSTVGTSPRFSPPVSPLHADYVADQDRVGSGILSDAGVAFYDGLVYFRGGTTFEIAAFNVSGTFGTITPVGATSPFTWGTGDSMMVIGTYDIA